MSADFTMFAGDDKSLEITLKDSAGAAIDITGVEIRWHMSRSVDARPATLEKAIGDGITVIDAPTGRFDVALDSADTETIRGAFYHEVEIIDSADKVATVLTGTITINPALIKPEA